MVLRAVLSQVLYVTLSCLLLWTFSLQGTSADSWRRPGCRLLGYEQLIEIPGCRSERIRMNACRGYCMTYSFPSNLYTLFLSGGDHVLTSHGSCCTIKTTHDVHFTLQCENNHVYENVIKSAASCECSLCEID